MLILPLSIVLSFLAPLPQRSSGRDIAVTSFTAHPSAALAPLASADLDGVAEQCAAHVEEPLPRAISAAGSTAIQAANERRRHLKIVQRVVIHERRRTCDPQLSADGNDTDPDPFNKLLLSLLIDAIGMATYLLPVAGETGDLAWAPISAYLIYQLYGNGLISGLAFAEELLPGLDIIPTATIAWVLENTEFGRRFAGKAPSPSQAPPSTPPSTPWENTQPPPDIGRSTTSASDGLKRAEGFVVDEDKSV